MGSGTPENEEEYGELPDGMPGNGKCSNRKEQTGQQSGWEST